jgi:LysM repeat protein
MSSLEPEKIKENDMKKATSLLLFFTILLLVACGGGEEETPTAVPTIEIPPTSPPSTETPPPDAGAESVSLLQSSPWQWVSHLDQAAGETGIPDPQNYVVSFLADGTVQVKADCNNAAGTYTADGSSLTITMGPVTLAACPEGSRSDQFLTLLGSAAQYAVADTELRIDLLADAGNLTFIPEWANPPSSPTPVPPQPTAVPPTAVPPQPTAVPPGGVVDTGPRQYANGTYAAPYYTIAAGDTLYSIGLRFGLSVNQLIAANPAAASGIVTGQSLVIPGAGVPVQPIEPPVVPAPAYERVTFDAGSIVATRNGVINNAQPAGYVLRVLAGQTMEIATSSSGEPLLITVQGPDGAMLPVNGENGQINNNTWLPVPTTGDYYVTISPTTTPESPSLAFTITFVIQ